MLTDREQKLVHWLRSRKVATMRQLQHQFQVSHMTVFRALNSATRILSIDKAPAFCAT